MTPPKEPQSAAEYDDRTTAAVKSVLIEIGQILGSFKGKFAIIGGAVPWLLLASEDMPHVGTLEGRLGVDPLPSMTTASNDAPRASSSVRFRPQPAGWRRDRIPPCRVIER